MADIPIEKKSSGGTPWWAWVLGLLVLALIVYLIFEFFVAEGAEAELDDEPGARIEWQAPESAPAFAGTEPAPVPLLRAAA